MGSRKDSQTYVSMKRKACAEVGIQSFNVDLSEDVSEEELIRRVHELNSDSRVHGLCLILILESLFFVSVFCQCNLCYLLAS